MRRKDREISETNDLLKIIDECKVCRIAMRDEEGLYIVPLNFGYAYREGKLTLYFHSAKEGRKICALSMSPNVCFELDCEHRLIEEDEACGYGYSFKSIIGNGTARFVAENDEKKKALSFLMKHQTGKDFTFTDAMIAAVAVFKVDVDSISGKYHE